MHQLKILKNQYEVIKENRPLTHHVVANYVADHRGRYTVCYDAGLVLLRVSPLVDNKRAQQNAGVLINGKMLLLMKMPAN